MNAHSVFVRCASGVFGISLAVWCVFGAGCEPTGDDEHISPPKIDLVYTENREPCAHRNPDRNAYFGDLHVHTYLSFDARAYGNHLTPADAYRFARGEEVQLPPLSSNGLSGRSARLERPLDFLAVTDHGELLGEVARCTTESSPVYEHPDCVAYRDPDGQGALNFGLFMSNPTPQRSTTICGLDRLQCEDDALKRWEELQSAAHTAYDRTEKCSLTTFVGYEYTNTSAVSNLHRNVVFRNDAVPKLPITYYEGVRPLDLWKGLDTACNQGDSGCEVLVLPHNSNLSNGQLFYPRYPDAQTLADEKKIAELRRRLEPVVEIFQHKGSSECRNGFKGIVDDPLCTFEKLRPADDIICPDDEPGNGGMRLWGCVHRLDFIRNVLLEGLVEAIRLGVNPYQLGVIGSTDTHNGIPGRVATRVFDGHVGVVDDTAEKRLADGNITHDGFINNPGGLAGVWAYENSRDAIFDAIKQRATFATSGPRIKPRFFAGWDYAHNLCGKKNPVRIAQASGVMMGQVLSPQRGESPHFFVSAEADDGGMKAGLQRIQIIKGWVDKQGVPRHKIYDVAGDAKAGKTLDAQSCDPKDSGFRQLCGVWTDPDFNAQEHAFYYARILEVPTCRWSTLQCRELDVAQTIARCAAGQNDMVQQRAWTSPIWYTPPKNP